MEAKAPNDKSANTVPSTVPSVPSVPSVRDVTAPMTTTPWVRAVAHKVLSAVIEELSEGDSRRMIQDRIVDPLVSMMCSQMMPYLLAAVAVVVVMLLMTAMTLALSALFYFKSMNFR